MKIRITIVAPLETNVGSRFCSFCSDRIALMMGLRRNMIEGEKMRRINGSAPVMVRLTNSERIRRRIRIQSLSAPLLPIAVAVVFIMSFSES
jgi:hypothetical protein